MADRRQMLKSSKMPLGRQAKEKLDEYLNEYLNIPLAKAGYEDIGAALSAAASAAGELVIPEDLADLALSAVPGLKLAKTAKKGMRAIKPAEEALDYAKIAADEARTLKEAAKTSQEVADTLKYGKMGEIERIPGKKKLEFTKIPLKKD